TSDGDVTLTSKFGDIVDCDNEPIADVVANSIGLNAPNGNIGSAENPFDINSSMPKPGKVNADAKGNIFIIEVRGDLNVGHIVSHTGDVNLTTLAGSILDANNDSGVDIQGVNITLDAKGGDIGEPGDYLDLDSSNPSPGKVSAKATGKQ